MTKALEPIIRALLWFWRFFTDQNRPNILICIYLRWKNIIPVTWQEYEYLRGIETEKKALLDKNMALNLEIERRDAVLAQQNDNTHSLAHLHSELDGVNRSYERTKDRYKKACREIEQSQSVISNIKAENNVLKETGCCLLLTNKMAQEEAEELKINIQSLESLLDETRRQLRDEQQIQKWLSLQAKETKDSVTAEIQRSTVILSDIRQELQDAHVCRNKIIAEAYTKLGRLEIEKESVGELLTKAQKDLLRIAGKRRFLLDKIMAYTSNESTFNGRLKRSQSAADETRTQSLPFIIKSALCLGMSLAKKVIRKISINEFKFYVSGWLKKFPNYSPVDKDLIIFRKMCNEFLTERAAW